MSNQTLRKTLKKRRRQVPYYQQRYFERLAWRSLSAWPAFTKAQHIACYLDTGGEFPTRYIINQLWRHHKTVYLPLLKKDRSLNFQRYYPASHLQYNRFVIPEPHPNARQQRSAYHLDLVLTPLLGFDDQGHRLGMGGGYYDRTFHFLQQKRRFKPTLIGLAYQCQSLAQIEAQPWDVPLNGILTEKGLRLFPRRKSE